jgi:phage terminase large subunit-like protein
MDQPRHDCPVLAYARDITEGRIPACKWVKLACKRHLDDLANGEARGIWWDQKAADRAIRFFGFLKHSKGKSAGQPFVLSLWQKFVVGCVFGWKRADGTRRFRDAWLEVPRKMGKTTLAAGIALLLLVADNEMGCEVYSTATKRDQSKLSHGEAKRMVKASPALKKRIEIYRDNLSVESTNSKYEPIGADADTADGLNPHGLICDEVHAWKGREFWDVLDTAMGARAQPLKFCITTAAADSRQETVYDEQHKYAKNVLEGRYPDDALFALIYTIDADDDWTDEKSWAKANPNLGISVAIDYLRDKFRKAERSPSSANAFKRLYLNVRTASADGWLPMDLWDKCGLATFDPKELDGKDCFGGLDIANSSDLAAFVLIFPWEDGFRLIAFFWCPDEARDTRGQKLRDLLAPWVEAGFINATEGNEIDLKAIEECVKECASKYNLRQVAFDPWNATATAQNLMAHGIAMFKFLQNIHNFNEPSRLFESLVRQCRLQHNANPVLTWMAGNVTMKSDGVGNMMPDRKKSANKIDGIPAGIMSLSQATLAPAESSGGVERW